MSRRKRKAFCFACILFGVMAFGVITQVQARCGMCDVGAADTRAETTICNTTCPVMGGEVSPDTSYTAEYKGRKIGFCCADCVTKFKKDPEMYIGKVTMEK